MNKYQLSKNVSRVRWSTAFSNSKSITGRFLSWLTPRNCLLCQEILAQDACNRLLCGNCDIHRQYRPSYCQHCGKSFAANLDYCGRCLLQAPYYDHCVCPFDFKLSIQQLIWRFKYQQQPFLAKPLAELFCAELEQSDECLPEAIIAVPCHAKTLRERGYNQSYLLAKNIAKRLEIPLISGTLSKSRPTEKQAKLKLKQRQNNLKGSFEIVKPLQVQHLAIMDDVITSGATMNEISKILKKNGVDYVQAWGLAHTP